MSQLDIGSGQEEVGSDFELVVQIRDYKGDPTGRTKSLKHHDGAKIADFWQKMVGKPKRKKHHRARKNEQLPTNKEAEKILKQINKE